MTSEIQKAKSAVISAALGICTLDDKEVLECLEKLYWLGFKAGSEVNKEAASPEPHGNIMDYGHD